MNILMLGCSVGVPNYAYGIIPKKPIRQRWAGAPNPTPPTAHTEFLLRNLGYNVVNSSQNNSSNLNSLDRARKLLAGESVAHPRHDPDSGNRDTIKLEHPPGNIDWVIWFHTELIRDASDADLNRYPIAKMLDNAAEIVYSAYAKFIQELGAQVAVVGGAGDVLPAMYRHIQPTFCIPSWRSYIFKESLPSMNFLGRLEKFKLMADTTENKMLMLQQQEIVRTKLAASDLFPDNNHPGAVPHRELAEVLHRVF
jgi:hypothetical protein